MRVDGGEQATGSWRLCLHGLCPVLPIHITTFNAPRVSRDDGRPTTDWAGQTIERMTDMTDGNDTS